MTEEIRHDRHFPNFDLVGTWTPMRILKLPYHVERGREPAI